MIRIERHTLSGRAVLAPMAGVTDLPFRQLCRQFGAALTVSEMVISNADLRDSRKTQLRLAHDNTEFPRSVQIAGSDPDAMAEAARFCQAQGADIVDINMGCPAKKVCKRDAGSALLRDPQLVRSILQSVVAAVTIPVTLKIRTGWSPDQRNGVDIALMAQDAGIKALAVHGRTRACRYHGAVEYDTIAAIKQSIEIPLFANGDITSTDQARQVLEYTGADGIMIGRGAQGRPWFFRELNQYLADGTQAEPVSPSEWTQTVLQHVLALHAFYGERQGVKIARKHVGWYLQHQTINKSLQSGFNQLTEANEQIDAIYRLSEQWQQYTRGDIAA